GSRAFRHQPHGSDHRHPVLAEPRFHRRCRGGDDHANRAAGALMRIAAEEFGGGAVLEPSWVAPRPVKDATRADRAGSRSRVRVMIGAFVLLYGTICVRLVMLGFMEAAPTIYQSDAAAAISAARPDLV